ncbi:MAG: hypothetical protein R2702_05110 [Acidimicrobiales bacterium]
MPPRVRAAVVAVALGVLGAATLVAWAPVVGSATAERAEAALDRRAPSLDAWHPKVPAPLRAASSRGPMLLALLAGVAALVARWVPIRTRPVPILAVGHVAARSSAPRAPPGRASTPR